MRKVSIFCLVFVIVACYMVSCKKHHETPAPFIDTITPMKGIEGMALTITGKNLTNGSSQGVVKFNGLQASVTSASPTQLITSVPAGATTGKITVTVEDKVATSSADFTVLVAETLTSFSPTSGKIGDQVVLTGTNFSTTLSDNMVTFNGQPAIVTVATATQLTVTVPSGATSGKIMVIVNGVSATTSTDFTVVFPSPTITSFAPAYGLPGSSVSITGTNFSTTTDGTVIKFGGDIQGTVTVVSSTSATVTVPNGAVSGKISVSVGAQSSASATDFEVLKDIPRNGLVAFYPFKGNANDASGNGLNGTVNGASMALDRFQKSNQSYSFNGTDSYITMGNPPALQVNTHITIAAWINTSVLGNGQTAIYKIFSDPDHGYNPALGYDLEQGFNKFEVHSFAGYNDLRLSSIVGSTVTTGDWVFVAFTFDDKVWKFYQDNVQTDGNTYPSTILPDASKGDLIIGGPYSFNGLIDDVTIYNRALSASEITQLYNQTVTKY